MHCGICDWHSLLVHIIPLCVPIWNPPSRTCLNRIIKTEGRSKTARFDLAYPWILALLLTKVTFEYVEICEVFNLRGISIFHVYPPIPTTLLPPSLRDTARRVKVDRPLIGESKPVTLLQLVSLHYLSSVACSPVSLPYNNLGEFKQRERNTEEIKFICCWL